MKKLYIDVTQFQRSPSRTGIQRLVKAFVDQGKNSIFDPIFILHHQSNLFQINKNEFIKCLESFWANELDSSQTNWRIWELISPLSVHELSNSIYLLPEVTYVEGHHEMFARISKIASTVAIVFDLFPMTHPQYFSDSGHRNPSRYIRSLAEFDLLICISENTKKEIERIFPNFKRVEVNTLGCDNFANPFSVSRNRNRYLVAGTVEPRKNHLRIFEAFSEVNRRGKYLLDLVFVGRPGWIPNWQTQFFLDQLKYRDWFKWESNANDETLRKYLQQSNALVSIGIEGFGLPVYEARSAGCNVIFDGIQPAAELIEDDHCVRVDSTNTERFADAIELVHASFLKLPHLPIQLPSWSEYVEKTFRLISRYLD